MHFVRRPEPSRGSGLSRSNENHEALRQEVELHREMETALTETDALTLRATLQRIIHAWQISLPMIKSKMAFYLGLSGCCCPPAAHRICRYLLLCSG
jgi:hypothetical protein